MSADNWTICPECAKQALKEKEKLQQKVSEAYGRVPSSVYLAMLEESNQDLEINWTLREDYEVGFFDGVPEFFVKYNAHCSVCGFEYEYKYTEIVTL